MRNSCIAKDHWRIVKLPLDRPDSYVGYVRRARHVIIMKSFVVQARNIFATGLITAIVWMAASLPASAQAPPIRIVQGTDVVEVQAVAPNIVRVHFQPGGKTTPRTLMMDPGFQPAAASTVHLERNGEAQTLSSPEMKVVVSGSGAFSVQVQD